MTRRQSEEYLFHQCCTKIAANTVMASRLWLPAYNSYNYLILTFQWFISAGQNMILGGKSLHFSPHLQATMYYFITLTPYLKEEVANSTHDWEWGLPFTFGTKWSEWFVSSWLAISNTYYGNFSHVEMRFSSVVEIPKVTEY